MTENSIQMETKSNTGSNIKNKSGLTISCDRQVRPSMVAFDKSVKYSGKCEAILSKIPSGTLCKCITELLKVTKVDIESFYITFNGQAWARSRYLHFKMFIEPEVCLKKQLYPQWSHLTKKAILSNFKSRWDSKLFAYLKSLVMEISIGDLIVQEIYKSDGYLHGVYSSKMYKEEELKGGLLTLEKHLFKEGFKGEYSIFIYPYLDNKQIKYFIGSRVDEKAFRAKYPIVKIIASDYTEPRRFYYTKSKQIQDSNFHFPTSKSISLRRSRR